MSTGYMLESPGFVTPFLITATLAVSTGSKKCAAISI